MTVAYVQVKKFAEFQHYKNRCPPWIKLHRGVLSDYKFSRLQDASKAHLVMIWLLASECDNKIPADAAWIGQRIGATEPVDLNALLDSGFLELAGDRRDASAALASCAVPARERRGEESRVEGETEQIAVSPKPASRATDEPTDGQVLAHERATLWIPDEQPPADWSEGRSITVYREQRAKGATGWDLLAAIDGLAELWRRGDPDWLRKRGKACIRAVNRTYNGVRPMWDVALEASRERSPPVKAKHGQPRSIADLLPKAG